MPAANSFIWLPQPYLRKVKLKLTSALAYSVVNTVREEEYSRKHPKIKHTYLQFSLGAKYKLK